VLQTGLARYSKSFDMSC